MTKPLKILHLEDNKTDAEFVKELLSIEAINCTIINVDNREDFLKEIEKGTYDLVLADYSLPSFDGLSALKELQKTNLKIPFILVSAVLGEELAIEALQSGATDYVLKSRPERLVPAIQRALREVEERDQRKRLESEITELQSMYQKISERVRGFLKMDLPSGNYTMVDKFLEELSGYTTQEWYDNPDFIRKIIHPGYKNYYQENFERMKNGLVPKMMEYKIIRKDGEERWWLQFTIGAYDINQKLVSVSQVIVDNTEQKESFIKYQNLFENALVGMYRTDVVTGKIIEANENMAQLFGCSTIEEIKQFKAGEFYPNTKTRDEIVQILTKNGFVNNYHLNLKKKDGSKMWVSLSARIYPKEDFIEGVMVDISAQKKAQEELARQEKELEEIFEHTGTATLMIDEDMTVLKSNNQVEKMYGYTKEELDGKKWIEFVFHEDLQKMIDFHQLRRIDTTKAPSNYETRIKHKDGHLISSYLTVGLIPETKKSIASFLDITQRKKAEDALRRDRRAFQIIAEAALHSKDIRSLSHQILEGLIETLEFEFGTVRLYDTETNQLEIAAISGLSKEEESKLTTVDLDDPDNLAAHVARTKQALYALDIETDIQKKNLSNTPFKIQDTKAFISWPILNSRNELIGTLQLIAKHKKKLEEQDKIFFESIARLFATGLERKLTDEALIKMERRQKLLANIVENSNEVVIQSDTEGIIFYANSSVEEIFGYTPEELIGQSVAILSSPGGEETQRRIFEEVIQSGSRTTIETVRKHKDGTLIPVIMNISTYKEEDSEDVTTTAIIVDISDIKKLEASLKERSYELEVLNKITSAGNQAKNMNELFDFLLNAILTSLDFTGGAIFFIDKFSELAILQRSLGLPNNFVKMAEKLSIRNKTFKRAFLDGKTIIAEDFASKSNGHMDFGVGSLLVVPFFSKQLVSGALMLSTKEKRNITKEDLSILEAIGREIGTSIAKMRAEEDLIASDDYIETIFEAITKDFIVFDIKTGKLYQLNRTLQNELQYSDHELSRMKFIELLSNDEKKQYDEIIKGILNKSIKQETVILITKDKKELQIEFHFYVTKISNSNVIIAINHL